MMRDYIFVNGKGQLSITMAKVIVFVSFFCLVCQYALCTYTIHGGDFEWNENSMIEVTSAVNKVLQNIKEDLVTPHPGLEFVNCRNIYYSTDSTITKFFLEKWEELEKIVDTHFMKNCSKSSAPRINIAFRVSGNTFDELENYWKDRNNPEENLKANLNSAGIFSVIMDWSSQSRIAGQDIIWKTKDMLKEYFNMTSVKIATEFKGDQVDFDALETNLYDSDINLIIIKFSFLREQFPLSIGLLQTYVQNMTSRWEKYKHRSTEIYYHFQFENNETSLVRNNVLRKYQNIFLNYTLTISSYTQTPIILDKLHFVPEMKNKSVNQRLEPLNWIQSIKPEINEMESLHGVGTVFKSIYLGMNEWVCWVDCQKNPSNISTFSAENNCHCGYATLMASINATLIVYHFNFNETLSYTQISQSGNITVDKIVLSTLYEKAWLNSPDLNNIISPIRNMAMKNELVCELKIHLEEIREEMTYEHPALSPCRDLLDMNITNEIMWTVAINMNKFDLNSFEMNIFSDLERINIQRLRFQMKNPKINVKLMILFSYVTYIRTSSLYCDENILRYNQYLEAIINWAGVHDITMGLFEYKGILRHWWTSLQGPEELIQNEYTFVTSVRNAPMSMSNMIKVEPCLNETSSVSETIPFAQDMIGVTLLCNVSTASEFEVMLRFAVFKFTNVEIRIGKRVENIRKVTTALRQIFSSRFDTDTGTQGRRKILIEMDLPEEISRQQKYLHEFTMLVKTLEDSPSISIQGVHINFGKDIGFSTHILEKVERNLEVSVEKDLQLGVSFQNCARELNELTGNASAAKKFNVKYVICQEPRVVASNENEGEVERLLDACLVLNTAFHNVNPSLGKVYFQLELVGSEDVRAHIGEIKFLKFVSDVNKYGKGYNLCFFFPAFDIPDSGTVGWWRVGSSSSVSNPYTYSEKESEILHGNTRRPNISAIPTDSTVPTNITTVLVSALGPAGAGVMVGALVAHRMKRNYRILSRSEEKKFLKGNEASGNDNAYQNLTFDESCSLSKEEIQFDSSKILGAGNFGTVFKGVCRGNPVAVKAPNEGCSKEIFKSMLTEVKLLCYIGEHDNVITFVGAYVKEISKGVIHIATALCENGSLQSYLRRRQTESRNGTDNSEIEMTSIDTSELIKFSQQIASGMNYIAGKNVVHGDLATRNVLLDEYNVCKITDFGLARKLYEYNKYVKQSHEPLPWRWLSYESLKMMEFTTKSDVWSYGVTLWEIFSLGAVPYPGLTWMVEFVDELEGGMRMTKPKLGTNEIYEKIRDCWNISPDLRPTFADLNEYFASQIQSDYMVCAEKL